MGFGSTIKPWAGFTGGRAGVVVVVVMGAGDVVVVVVGAGG